MFQVPVIPKTKKTTSTVNNIIFDPCLKRFCMHDVRNLKFVGKLECLSQNLGEWREKNKWGLYLGR